MAHRDRGFADKDAHAHVCRVGGAGYCCVTPSLTTEAWHNLMARSRIIDTSFPSSCARPAILPDDPGLGIHNALGRLAGP